MAFNDEPGRAEYIAGAGQTVFPFSFKIYQDGDVKVYLTPSGQDSDDATDLLMLTNDYTISINGDLGGTITLVSGASVSDAITTVRELSVTRLVDYQTGGDLLATTLNLDQNYQTYLSADLKADDTRFLSIPDSSQGVSAKLPPVIPLSFMQWNASGQALVNVTSLQADGFLWTAADVYTKTETNNLFVDKLNGVSIWNTSLSYPEFARIMRNGIIYQSLSDANQGNDPLSTLDTFWGYTVSQISGYKNILINGDKRVNQRSYADGVLANGVYGYDRWKGADTDANIEQVIEQQNIITGTYTISWVGGGTATVDGNAGLSSGASVAITVASDISVKAPKASTDIQLEPGSVATPFEKRSIGLELSLCQRYYEVITSGSGDTILCVAQAVATGSCHGVFRYSEKRVIPTVDLGSGTGYTVSNSSGSRVFTTNVQTVNNASLVMTGARFDKASQFVAGNAVKVDLRSSIISIDAEL